MSDRTNQRIVTAHGGGGEMTKRLLDEHVIPKISNALLDPLTDGAFVEGLLGEGGGRVCFTTDAFVVQPLEFPGGDIGGLAVCGTVNDLAVMGARPLALSLALVVEEGLALATLDRIMESVARAAREAGVVVATGDTKVVERTRDDGLVITTAGVGEARPGVELGAERIEPGDRLAVSGRIAEHGLAVLSAREGLGFSTKIASDCAPLWGLAEALLDSGAEIRFMRDPTRGGLAGVLADLVEDTGLTLEVDEAAIPVSAAVRHAAELLGLDPLVVANEGKLVCVFPERDAPRALAAMWSHELGRDAAVIGRFEDAREHEKEAPPLVELVTRAGGRRVVLRPYGEELPRIC